MSPVIRLRRVLAGWAKRVTLLVLLRWSYRLLRLNAVAALGFATWAQLVALKPTLSNRFLQAISTDWPLLALVVFFSIIAFVNTDRVFGRPTPLVRKRVGNALEIGLHRMRDKVRLTSPIDRTAIENVLRSIEALIEQELQLDDPEQVQVNLLLVRKAAGSGNPLLDCVARSQPGKPSKPWAWDLQTAACKAIEGNVTVVQTDTHRIAAFRDKPYRCVLATPVAEGERAYGAVTADSPNPTLFKGAEERIGRLLRPYCAMLLLAIARDADYHRCPSRDLR